MSHLGRINRKGVGMLGSVRTSERMRVTDTHIIGHVRLLLMILVVLLLLDLRLHLKLKGVVVHVWVVDVDVARAAIVVGTGGSVRGHMRLLLLSKRRIVERIVKALSQG